MHTDFNFANLAALSAMAMLAAVFGSAMAAIVIVVAFLAKKYRAAAIVSAMVGCGALTYVGLLLVLSLTSQTVVLPRGGEKYFCELDCHIAYAVTDAQTVKTLGSGPQQVKADGSFYVVTVRSRFDETTTSPRRPRTAELRPNRRELELVTTSGNHYRPSEIARDLVENSAGSIGMDTPLIPGQYYFTKVAFQIPAGEKPQRLLLTSSGWDFRWMIGHENSWMHNKTWFALDGTSQATASGH